MNWGVTKKTAFIFGLSLVLLFGFSALLKSETPTKGNVLGFIYGSDGTTPIEGASLKVVNVSTGSVYESTISNNNGALTISEVETGIYEYVVTTVEGRFVSENSFGLRVQGEEAEKMAIIVNPIAKNAKSEPMAFPEPEQITGESYVGRIIGFDLEAKVAEVYIVRGMIKRNDKVHVKGEKTNFDMKVKNMNKDGDDVKSLLTGETGVMAMKENASIGDAIYLAVDKGILPLILGAAGLTAGTVGVVGYANVTAGTEGVIEFDKFWWDPKESCNPQPTSPFKPRH
jgi:hypothetical protein